MCLQLLVSALMSYFDAVTIYTDRFFKKKTYTDRFKGSILIKKIYKGWAT
jgi:hypothetical protein